MSLFFLSYARADRDPYLDAFYDDLVSLVRRKAGIDSVSDVAFRDVRSLELGDAWSDEILQALATARSMVCLLSPTYFTREWCRKELSYFMARAGRHARGGKAPPLVIPIQWYAPRRSAPFPEAVTRLQGNADFGDEYTREGLQLLCRVNKYKDLYQEICTQIANRIIDVTSEHVIPDDPVPTDIAAIPDLALPGAAPGPQKLAPERGPRRVQFILAAASHDELEGVRQQLDAYGESGADWCPYLPPNRRSIAPVLQQLAAQEDCTSEVVTTVDGLVDRLKKALDQKNMVIIVVDPWTLQLGTYAKALRDYDELDFLHCAVVVPWNETDLETTGAREDLHALLKETLLNKVLAKDPKRFRADVSSPEQLEANVRDLLVELRQRILERMDVVRKIKAERVIAKPGISAVRP